ncbi:hypothetical protein CC85DRAFT_287564 [Cutaneotrichosporon oleaginosum]|uniref:BAG domain-containing protein n=1 Tax=Cutaneotrichosporon oleaginosum TaxID=879819 RepID=A0A0J0XH09_9TREE|nr:uncharacterized protein CC85DRAFT_287564 [Cutaneotrichosporon oleaginosum]KLT40343.1 hypothetical protein CC85DRAFT_287564 [Cutaneotrichosporon oleaginosum]TXT06492.1 hypothetical protein COLE_05823 [Cutaneotrichosporon oleaginosum]
MSYYGHPYVIPQGYYYPQQAGRQPQTPVPAASASAEQLALEERQALAYLQSVRRRREAAEAAMALEAKERQRAQAEREEALRAAAERHNALIQAARRERAIREALERERQREAAFQQALQAHQAQQVQAAIEAERRRQTAAAEAYARALGEHRQRSQRSLPTQAPQCQIAAPFSPSPLAKVQQPAAFAPRPETTLQPHDEVDLDGINALLGQLFGFNLATEPTEEPPVPKPKKETPQTKAEPSMPADEAKAATSPPQTAPATAQPAARKDDAELPEDLNELLNQFLGLNVAPAAEGERSNLKASQQLVGNAVEDLNAFLGQYGLEFVPESESESDSEYQTPKTSVDTQDEPKAKITNESGWAVLPAENDKNAKSAAPTVTPANTAQPTPPTQLTAERDAPAPPKDKEERHRQASREPDEEAPFTSTLSSYQNLPPYLRDILSQMEAAMCEEDQCECNPETRTPCVHGPDGMPCAAHRQRTRRERALAKKRAAKERREQRRAKKFATAQDDKDAAGIPLGASPNDTVVHHDVYAQAAAAGAAVEHEVADANVSAQEAREEAIPENEPQSVVDEHRSVAEQAVAAGTSQLHAPHPTTESQEKIDAREEQQEAIPSEASKTDIAAHREIAEEVAAKPHSELRADAPAFQSKSDKKTKDAQPSSPEAEESVQKLNAISQQLKATCAKFKFPRTLSFSPSLADATQPPLLYTRNNHAYHAQAHSLMQLLLAVDGVQSHGDKAVRNRRKAVVKEIEGALNDLEKGRDAKWAEVKARRERGESDDDDDDWILTGDTTDATSDLDA